MSIVPEQLRLINPTHQIVEINDGLKESYQKFHDEVYYDHYWTADRIYQDLARWNIYIVLEEDEIIGSVFTFNFCDGSGKILAVKFWIIF